MANPGQRAPLLPPGTTAERVWAPEFVDRALTAIVLGRTGDLLAALDDIEHDDIARVVCALYRRAPSLDAWREWRDIVTDALMKVREIWGSRGGDLDGAMLKGQQVPAPTPLPRVPPTIVQR